MNTAFFDFCVAVDRVPLVFPTGEGDDPAHCPIRFGMIRK